MKIVAVILLKSHRTLSCPQGIPQPTIHGRLEFLAKKKNTVNTSFGDSPLKGLCNWVGSSEQHTCSDITTPVFRSIVRLTSTEFQEISMGGWMSCLDMDFLVQETLMLSSHCQNIAGICMCNGSLAILASIFIRLVW